MWKVAVRRAHSRGKVQVGFFLHTPFPSSEYYRTLPYREELLRGVLKADLIGFHIYDYARHFISSCTRILGLEGTPYGVEENGTLIRVAAFPIGINPDKFAVTLREPEVVEHIGFLKKRCASTWWNTALTNLRFTHRCCVAACYVGAAVHCMGRMRAQTSSALCSSSRMCVPRARG